MSDIGLSITNSTYTDNLRCMVKNRLFFDIFNEENLQVRI